jgi:general stress protein 26
MMSAVMSEQQAGERLTKIVRGFKTAMLINTDMQGHPRARPMSIANHGDPEGSAGAAFSPPHLLTFVTRLSNPLLPTLEFDPKVCVTLQDGATYACLAGTATTHDDPERIHRLWSPAWRLWFPGGPEDPDIALIDCRMNFAEFWDASGTEALRFVLQAGKALLGGREIDDRRAAAHGEFDEREMRQLRLRR